MLNKARFTHGERDLDPIEGGAAITLVTRLSRESWSLAGFDVLRYARRDTPIRFIPRSPT